MDEIESSAVSNVAATFSGRVCLVTAHWPPRLSGHGDYVWHLANALADRGVDIAVIVLGQEEFDASPRFPVAGAPFPGSVGKIRAAVRAVWAVKPDVVCLQFEANAFRLQFAPHLLPGFLRASGIPVVLMYHELWAPRRFGWLAKLFLLSIPQRVATFSEWHSAGVRRFRRWGGVDLIAVPTNIPIARIGDRQLLRVRFGVERDSFIMTFFGFVSSAHRIECFLEALSAVRKVVPGARASIIGAFDSGKNGYHQKLAALSLELGLDSAVTWHGRVEDPVAVARLLCISDIGVLPYDNGVGENNGAFAALAAAGIPVVTTRGERSTNMEREKIALFAESDSGAIVAAAIQLATDPALAADLGERAKAWSKRREWDKVASAFIRVFDVKSPPVSLL